jgi:hypothetical protein
MRAVATSVSVARITKAFLLVVYVLAGVRGVANPLATQEDALEALKEIAVVDELVMMPMRDGVRLATNFFRPKGSDSNPVGTIFVRTPYNMNPWRDGQLNTGRYRAALDAVRRYGGTAREANTVKATSGEAQQGPRRFQHYLSRLCVPDRRPD